VSVRREQEEDGEEGEVGREEGGEGRSYPFPPSSAAEEEGGGREGEREGGRGGGRATRRVSFPTHTKEQLEGVVRVSSKEDHLLPPFPLPRSPGRCRVWPWRRKRMKVWQGREDEEEGGEGEGRMA